MHLFCIFKNFKDQPPQKEVFFVPVSKRIVTFGRFLPAFKEKIEDFKHSKK
jgi:hypothetical protein